MRRFNPNKGPMSLPDSPYDTAVTDINRPLIAPRQDYALDNFLNRNLTVTTPYVLVAGVSVRALARNQRRVGMIIQNKDATGDMFYSFGNNLGQDGLLIAPRGSVLFDFTTPADELYLFSAFNVYTIVMEVTRGVTAPIKKV